MLEVELKFRADHEAVRDRLPADARPLGGWNEADHYFNAPDRDFAATGEAFRLRRVGPVGVLTYKGPKQPGPAKTRVEIELPLATNVGADATAERLLLALGYRPVGVVRKHRSAAKFNRGGFEITVSLDDVDGVGRFVEVEAIADEGDATAAQAAVAAVAADLGLTEVEPRSYLRMRLTAEGRV